MTSYFLCFRALPNICLDDGVHGVLKEPVHGGEGSPGNVGQFEADIDGELGKMVENH